MDWFLYDNGLRHERVNVCKGLLLSIVSITPTFTRTLHQTFHLYNFIQLTLNSGSVQVQMLLVASQRSAMVRISDNGPR